MSISEPLTSGHTEKDHAYNFRFPHSPYPTHPYVLSIWPTKYFLGPLLLCFFMFSLPVVQPYALLACISTYTSQMMIVFCFTLRMTFLKHISSHDSIRLETVWWLCWFWGADQHPPGGLHGSLCSASQFCFSFIGSTHPGLVHTTHIAISYFCIPIFPPVLVCSQTYQSPPLSTSFSYSLLTTQSNKTLLWKSL